MSDELSDRRLHKEMTEEAISCPTCNVLFDLEVSSCTTNEERVVLNGLLRRKQLRAATLEDAIEKTKLQRKMGREPLPRGEP